MPSPGLIHGRAAGGAADRIRRLCDTLFATDRKDSFPETSLNATTEILEPTETPKYAERNVATAYDPTGEIKRGRSTVRKQTGRYESSCKVEKRRTERGQLSTIDNRRNLAETIRYLLPGRKILDSGVFQAYREEDAGYTHGAISLIIRVPVVLWAVDGGLPTRVHLESSRGNLEEKVVVEPKQGRGYEERQVFLEHAQTTQASHFSNEPSASKKFYPATLLLSQ